VPRAEPKFYERDFPQTTARRERRREARNRRLVWAGTALIVLSLAMLVAGVGVPYVVSGIRDGGAVVPEDKTLRLTVPAMARVDDIPVYTAAAGDLERLDAGAVHLEGTGQPWESEANVYIAGHRLGYPGTGSFLVFYDLDKLKEGDRVVLTDASGRRYVYRVFDKLVVGSSDFHVTEPVPGRNIVSLQTCTLPDYTSRLIVRAELTKVEG
jgi:sortase A